MVKGVPTLEARSKSGDGEDFRQSPEYAERLRQVFARNLRDHMRKRGWNQSELARRANNAMPKDASVITRDNISRYARGENFPGPERIEAIAKAFEIKPMLLIPEDDWLTEDEYNRLQGQKKWDVRFTTTGTACRIHVDADVPFDVGVQIMEMLRKFAPAEARVDED